ncbi:hypothetical protein EMCRGX_G026279 [Ephydatia muelleri]
MPVVQLYHLVRCCCEEDAVSVVPDSQISRRKGAEEAACTVKWGKAYHHGEIMASGTKNEMQLQEAVFVHDKGEKTATIYIYASATTTTEQTIAYIYTTIDLKC